MSVQSRHSARRVPTHRSQNALALGARIGVRTMLAPCGPEHLVKGAGELGVPVVDQELRGPSFLLQGHGQFRACWVTQAESGFAVPPSRWTLLVPSSIHASTYGSLSRIVSTVRKWQARIPAASERRNSLHEGPRLGAGPRPELRSTVAIVVAETLMPSFRSSSRIRM
jgi:hypothetical protein